MKMKQSRLNSSVIVLVSLPGECLCTRLATVSWTRQKQYLSPEGYFAHMA